MNIHTLHMRMCSIYMSMCVYVRSILGATCVRAYTHMYRIIVRSATANIAMYILHTTWHGVRTLRYIRCDTDAIDLFAFITYICTYTQHTICMYFSTQPSPTHMCVLLAIARTLRYVAYVCARAMYVYNVCDEEAAAARRAY